MRCISQPGGILKKINLLVLSVLASLTVNSNAQILFNNSVGTEFEPGIYGQINIGNSLTPPLIYAQPMVAGQPIYGAQNIYVYAPIEETKNWGYYCNRYTACGFPVFFILYDEGHPFWARYHEFHRLPFRGEVRSEQRREPIRQERREEFREERREPTREERRDHDFQDRR